MSESRSLESMVRAYISRELGSKPESLSLKNDTLLIESGILDSLSLLKLVLFLEQQFAFSFHLDELVTENFKTIDAICAYVRSKQATQKP